MPFDVVIVGGGPAGLAAALALGRGRKRVLLCDAGPARNAVAARVHNFVTRDGTPPAEFRRIGREQLTPYDTVEARDVRVESIDGELGQFRVTLSSGDVVEARRVLLCVGMVDELPDLPGYRELWGKAIFQCPYCHGWEVRDRPFGCLVPAPQWLDWALLLTGWTSDVRVFTDARFEVPADARARLGQAGVQLEERRIRRLVPAESGAHLAAVELGDGTLVPREVLFARPPQRQVALVASLGLALDDAGFVRVDDHQRETSRPGIHAAGDLTTMMQGAIVAAAAGTMTAAAINHKLTAERASQRQAAAPASG